MFSQISSDCAVINLNSDFNNRKGIVSMKAEPKALYLHILNVLPSSYHEQTSLGS